MDDPKPPFVIIQTNNLQDLENNINDHIEKGYWPLHFGHYDRNTNPMFYCTMYLIEMTPSTIKVTNIQNRQESKIGEINRILEQLK